MTADVMQDRMGSGPLVRNLARWRRAGLRNVKTTKEVTRADRTANRYWGTASSFAMAAR